MISIYIDGANLHQGAKYRGGLDYKKFKQRLVDKYKTSEIYLFLGYVKGNEPLYSALIQYGFKLVFKETLSIEGKIKGNCDAELVIKAVSDFYEQHTDKAVLVTGDGDFACLVDFFIEKKCKVVICTPNKDFCSYLLKKRDIPIICLEQLKSKFQ